jgi:hypothetical protein
MLSISMGWWIEKQIAARTDSADSVMTNKRQLQTELSAVSIVFLVLAFIAVIIMVYAVMTGSLRLEFNVLGFWIYFGLRRFSTGWRTCALVLIWIELIIMPIAVVLSIKGELLFWSIFNLAILCLNLWMYRALTRSNIRGLFYAQKEITAVSGLPS